MCAVSAIHDYARSIPLTEWTWESYKYWKQIKDAAEEFDRQTKQPDCVDPKKASFEEEILKRLKAIEDKLK